MNLQQSIKFLSQAHEDICRARTRLDKAVAELASFISEKGLEGESVMVESERYVIAEKSSNVGSYKYLAVEGEGGSDDLHSLEDVTGHNLHGDFQVWIRASGRHERLRFARNAEAIINSFAEYWNEKAAKFNAAAENAEKMLVEIEQQ